jgi:hypothetical protein
MKPNNYEVLILLHQLKVEAQYSRNKGFGVKEHRHPGIHRRRRWSRQSSSLEHKTEHRRLLTSIICYATSGRPRFGQSRVPTSSWVLDNLQPSSVASTAVGGTDRHSPSYPHTRDSVTYETFEVVPSCPTAHSLSTTTVSAQDHSDTTGQVTPAASHKVGTTTYGSDGRLNRAHGEEASWRRSERRRGLPVV